MAEISTKTEADEMEASVLGLVMVQEGIELGFLGCVPRWTVQLFWKQRRLGQGGTCFSEICETPED